jgi:hypothetical protein
MSILVPPVIPHPGGQMSRTHYQVLDISPHERDPKTIEEAALRCSAQARVYQLACELESALRLSEIAQALITLLDPVCRREYDRSLSKPVCLADAERRLRARRDVPALPRGKDAPPALGKDALVLPFGNGGVCDVKLVYRRRALYCQEPITQLTKETS